MTIEAKIVFNIINNGTIFTLMLSKILFNFDFKLRISNSTLTPNLKLKLKLNPNSDFLNDEKIP